MVSGSRAILSPFLPELSPQLRTKFTRSRLVDRRSVRTEDRLRAPAAEISGIVDGRTVRRRSRQRLSLRSMPGRDASLLRARDVRVQPGDAESVVGRADHLRSALRSVRRRQLLLVSRVSQARACSMRCRVVRSTTAANKTRCRGGDSSVTRN